MAKHSSIVGGSTASRLLACHGSYQACLALPPSADVPSSYAEEGTAMHAAMDELMGRRKRGDSKRTPQQMAEESIDAVRHDRALTREHLDTMILPALDQLDTLESIHDGHFKVVAVEASVKFPGIPGAHGTCDLILENEKYVMLVDWKFGAGVGVSATYPTPGGTVLNAQLAFYAKAALHTFKRIFTGRKIIVAIIQPRADNPLTFTEVTRRELRWFAEDLERAVIAALDYAPKRTKSEQCRWAPCKVNCPLWTGPLLELSALQPQDRTEMVTDQPSPYGDYLSKAKTLVDIVDQYKKEVDAQLHAYLADGGTVPGWRLKAKVKVRQWIDEKVVGNELHKLGIADDVIWKHRINTFAAIDAAAKQLGVKIPDHLRVAPVSNETTVCPTDDPAPVVQPHLAVEQFRAALAAVTADNLKINMETTK